MSDLFLSVCESVQSRYGSKELLPLDLVQQLVAAALGYGSLNAFNANGANDLDILAAPAADLPYFTLRPNSKFRQFCIEEERLEKRCSELHMGSVLNPSVLSMCLTDSLQSIAAIESSCEICEDEAELTQRLALLANTALLDDAALIARYREITISPLNRVIKGNLLKDTGPRFSLTFEVHWYEKSAITWMGTLAGDFVQDECTITMHRPKPRIFLLEEMTFPTFKAAPQKTVLA
jgi:hypothetical protein